MIPRILVPKNVQPVSASPATPPRRMSSELDVRKLVPPDLPQFELDARSSIPAYFNLEVLGSNIVVPRDMPTTPLDVTSKTPDYVPLAILGTRVAVPRDAHPGYLQPKALVAIQDLPDVLDPDVINTGEVNLMTRRVEEQTPAWNSVSQISSLRRIHRFRSNSFWRSSALAGMQSRKTSPLQSTTRILTISLHHRI